jgi:hypothetical protein
LQRHCNAVADKIKYEALWAEFLQGVDTLHGTRWLDEVTAWEKEETIVDPYYRAPLGMLYVTAHSCKMLTVV